MLFTIAISLEMSDEPVFIYKLWSLCTWESHKLKRILLHHFNVSYQRKNPSFHIPCKSSPSIQRQIDQRPYQQFLVYQ